MSLRTILNFARQGPGLLFSRSTSVAGCNLETSDSVNATMPDEDAGKDGKVGGITGDDRSEKPEVKQSDDAAPTCSEFELVTAKAVKEEPSNAETMVVEVSSESASLERDASDNSGDDCVFLGVRMPSSKQSDSQGNTTETPEKDLDEITQSADDNHVVLEGNSVLNAPCLRSEDISCTEIPVEIAAPPNTDQVPEQYSHAKDDVRGGRLCESASIVQSPLCVVDKDMSDVPLDRVRSPVPASCLDLNGKGDADGMMQEDSRPSCAAIGKALQDSPSQVGVTDPEAHSETQELVEAGLQTADKSLAEEGHMNISCSSVPCLPRDEGKASNGSPVDGPILAAGNSDSEQSFEAFRRTVRRKKRVVKIIDSDDEAVSESEASSQKSRSFFDDEAEESPPHFGDDDVFPSDCDKPENSDTDESFELVEDFFDAEAEESLGNDDECSKSDSGMDMLSQDEEDFVDSEGDRHSQEERYLRHSSRERSSSSDPTYIPEGVDFSPESQLFGAKVKLDDQKNQAEMHSDRDVDAEKCGKGPLDALQGEIMAGKEKLNILACAENILSKEVEELVGRSQLEFESAGRMETGNGAIVMVLPSEAAENGDKLDAETRKLKVESITGITAMEPEATNQYERRRQLIDRLLTSRAITEEEAVLLRSDSPEVENKQLESVVEVHEAIPQCELLIEGPGTVGAFPQHKLEGTADHFQLQESRKEPTKRTQKRNEEDDVKIVGADEKENQHSNSGDSDGSMDICIPEEQRIKEKPERKGKGISPANIVEAKHDDALQAAIEVPTDSVATGILCQGLVNDGSTRLESRVTYSVVEASREHGTAGDVDASEDKRRAKKRSKRLLGDLEVRAVKDSCSPSVELQAEGLETSFHGLTARITEDSLECQESLSLPEVGRDMPQRKKKCETVDKQIHPTKEIETRETRDKDVAASDMQSELYAPKELVSASPFDPVPDSGSQDSPRMEVPTKKRRKRQGGGPGVESTGALNLFTVEEEIPETTPAKREKRKKKRKNPPDWGNGFTSSARTGATSSPQAGCLLPTSMSLVEQLFARQGVEGLTVEAVEGSTSFLNEKVKRKKKQRRGEDTKVNKEKLMLEVADVCPEFSDRKSRRNKNSANDGAFIDGDKGSLKRKRRKGAQRKLGDASLKESDELEECTGKGIVSAIAFPVRKAKKKGSGKRRGQQSEDVNPQHSRNSDSVECIGLQDDVTMKVEKPLKQGIKHRKKESIDVAGWDVVVVKDSATDEASEEEGIKSMWDRYIAGSPAKPAKNSPSVGKKKRKHKFDRMKEEVMQVEAAADTENNETTLDNIWKKYMAQSPEKLQRSPFKQRRVVSGKQSKVARNLIPVEGHGASVSTKRKRKKKMRKL